MQEPSRGRASSDRQEQHWRQERSWDRGWWDYSDWRAGAWSGWQAEEAAQAQAQPQQPRPQEPPATATATAPSAHVEAQAQQPRPQEPPATAAATAADCAYACTSTAAARRIHRFGRRRSRTRGKRSREGSDRPARENEVYPGITAFIYMFVCITSNFLSPWVVLL